MAIDLQSLDLEKLGAELSFAEFVKQAWAVIEPATPLVWSWSMDAICSALQAVSEGRIHRLLVNVPPGFSKSLLVNVFWPAWEWGPRGMPALRYISASYAEGLATRDLVRCRDLLMSDWFSERWPVEFKADQNKKTLFENTSTGWRFATGVGGSLTGYRGDRAIVDDPHSVKTAESDAEREEANRWFAETLSTRYNNEKTFAIVVIMQRLHTRDVSGMILKDPKGWRHLLLPMEFEADRRCSLPEVLVPSPSDAGALVPFIDPRTEDGDLLCPERFSRTGVDELKRAMSAHGGSYAVAGQLQQRPTPRDGGMFPSKFARIVDAPAPAGSRRVRGWDLAASENGKATVGLVLAETPAGGLIIEDLQRFFCEPAETEERFEQVHGRDPRTLSWSIPQDPGQAGKVQKLAFARLLHGRDLHFSTESGDKWTRASPVASQWCAGNVAMVRAPWNDVLIAELALHPNGEFSDIGDALSRAYGFLLLRVDDEIGLVPGVCVEGPRVGPRD